MGPKSFVNMVRNFNKASDVIDKVDKVFSVSSSVLDDMIESLVDSYIVGLFGEEPQDKVWEELYGLMFEDFSEDRAYKFYWTHVNEMV